MSTIGNLSPSLRRQSFFSPAQSPQSPKTTKPSSPRASKIITSKSRKKVSFPTSLEEIELPRRQVSWRQSLTDMPNLWLELSAVFRRRISIKRLIKILILICIILLLNSIIPWKDVCFAVGGKSMCEREKEYIHRRKHSFLSEKRQTTREHKNHGGFRIPHQFEPYELIRPLYDLTHLDISPQLDVLKDAYSDSRFGLNKLRDGLPDLSKDSPGLSTKVRSFRDQAWKVSEAIGGFSKFFDFYIDHFQQETSSLIEELGKVKPGDDLTKLNTEDCKKVGEVWINNYKRLKPEIENLWRMKDKFSDIIGSVVEERENLEKALRKAESRMTKEAKKREWENFDFPSAYRLLERFSQGKTGDKIWGGYEETIKELIIYIGVTLKDANAQIEHLVGSFRQILSVDENEVDVGLINLPTIFNQMEVLNLTFEKYVRVQVLLKNMKEEMGEELKKRAHDSEERNKYYNYVISQQKGRRYKHITASRDRKREDFLQELTEKRLKERQKGS